MSVISYPKYPEFERWIIETHPALFGEWETEASEYLDLDEWIERNHFAVIDEWRRKKRTT